MGVSGTGPFCRLRRWGGQTLKHIFYVVAAICFLGVGVCLVRLANLPDDVGRTLQEVRDNDPSAREDVEALRETNEAFDELLRYAGFWFLGGSMAVIVARHNWDTVEQRR